MRHVRQVNLLFFFKGRKNGTSFTGSETLGTRLVKRDPNAI